ncbi:MAG: CHAD domain-containing protein [Planctomycetes bacterium]|nr:CHAD domain-containing protein [Planctomycetota bacterium]
MNIPPASPAHALDHWLKLVLVRARRVRADEAPARLHRLRVALRTVHTLARAYRAMDTHRCWRQLARMVREVLRELNAPRNWDVLLPLARRLAGERKDALCGWLKARTRGKSSAVRRALAGLPVETLRELRARCVRRASRLPAGHPAFAHLTLEALVYSRRLQRAAMQSGEPPAYHALRIALKRFRYQLEAFLPGLALRWEDELRLVQSILGELQDLQTLRDAVQSPGCPLSPQRRSAWLARIDAEVQQGIRRYNEAACSDRDLPGTWRREFPRGAHLRRAAVQRIEAAARLADPAFEQTPPLLDLAQHLRARLGELHGDPVFTGEDAADLLACATLVLGLKRDSRGRPKGKRSARTARRLHAPLGLGAANLKQASLVARFSGGALPSAAHKHFQALAPSAQQQVAALAAVLRLARLLHETDNAEARLLGGPGGMVLEGIKARTGSNPWRRALRALHTVLHCDVTLRV